MKAVRVAAKATAAMGSFHLAPYALSLIAYTPQHSRSVQSLMPRLFGVGRDGHMALTFDDGPDQRGTPEILSFLDDAGWKATFFMLGEMADRYSTVAQEVVAAGHEVAVHGYNHSSFLRMSLNTATEDIRRSREIIEDVTGTQCRWFRPSFGTMSGPSIFAARWNHLDTVLWTAWGQDWRDGINGRDVMADIGRGRLDGGTLLLHDSDCTSSPNSWQRTLEALPMLAERVSELGLEVGPLGDHFISGSR